MSLYLNLSGNGYLVPPGGYPFRLLAQQETLAEGVIPKGIATVSATVSADVTANVHLAIFTIPQNVGDPDGPSVAQSDLAITSTEQAITVTVPTNVAPACYIVRIWADGINATSVDSESRTSGGSYTTAQNPGIPVGITVESMVVS